jgi:hypothetical protein
MLQNLSLDTVQQQVDAKTVVNPYGTMAICLDDTSPNYGGLLAKIQETGQWFKQRPATTTELIAAEEALLALTKQFN